jgi:UDP-3-O-[3-hydroxymyristoyl] glucosamine N-acyltransferase
MKQKSIAELAEIVNGTVIGDGAIIISDISKINEGIPNTISFLANPRYARFLKDTQASAVFVPRSISESVTNLIQVDDPYSAFQSISMLYYPRLEVTEHFIHPSAIIEDGVKIEEPVKIGAFVHIEQGVIISEKSSIGSQCYIGERVKIGKSVILHPRVTILEECMVGARVTIHSGAVVGSDGFGYAKKKNRYLKIPQIGNVVIDEEAEIGANATIDRATIGSTYIGIGCKIDNLVQIAHNVIVGNHTAIAAQTGISGSTKVGENVAIAGQVGIVGHIEIGANVILGAQSGVSKSVPADSFYFGYPAKDHRKAKRIEVLVKKLPEIYTRLKELESKFKS